MENKIQAEEFCIEIQVEGNFAHFVDFMDYSREYIYEVIVEGFKHLVDSKSMSHGKVMVAATIQGKKFDSNFIYIGRETLSYLTEAILPYYIRREEYEKCAVVKAILDQFASEALTTGESIQ
jgi:hypothetical protein